MTLENDRQIIYALTHQDVASQLEAGVLSDAQRLYDRGHVTGTIIEDAELFGLVQDAGLETYAAELAIEDGEIYVSCTCEHQGPDLCAHIGALLLAWIHAPETFSGYDPSLASPPDSHREASEDYKSEYLDTLGDQTISSLREIARQRGIEIGGTRKEPIVQELAAALADIKANRTYIGQQSKAVQDLLIYLNLTLGPGYGFTLENILQNLQRRHTNVPRKTLHEQIIALAQQGLLLQFKVGNRGYYMLPQTVRAALPSRPGLAPLYVHGEDDLEIRERSATSLIQSCYALWTHLTKHHPRREPAPPRLPVEDSWPQLQGWSHQSEEMDDLVRRRRTPYNLYGSSATIPPPLFHLGSRDRGVLRHQANQSVEESEFNYALLEALSIVHGAPGEPIALEPQRFEQLLSMPPDTQTLTLLRAWIETISWSEMDLLRQSTDSFSVRRNLAYPSFSPPDLYREWRAGRWTVLRFLSTTREGDWISLDGFLKVIYEIQPNLIHTQTDTSVWWLESRKTRKQFGTTVEDWLESSGKFVTAVLEGPLYWFGAVRLGYKDARLVAFQLTPVGSFALERRDSPFDANPQLPPEGALELTDDMTVIVMPGQAPAQLHALLHIIGQLEETSPDQFVYRVTAEGVLSALEQGQTIDRLLAAVQHWCNCEIPPEWRKKILAWSQNYGKLHVYDDISLIELADDYALQELLSNTSLRDHLIHEFSPRLVAIQASAIDALVQEMEKRGYTPYVE